MKLVKSLLGTAAMALVVSGGVMLPVQDADAYTRCRNVYSNGVHKRICTTTRRANRRSSYQRNRRADRPRYRTVCRTYWRHGERYRNCWRQRVR